MTVLANIKFCEPYDVYIGRPGHGLDGYFGNPAEKNAKCPQCGEKHTTREACIECYKSYFTHRVSADAEFKRRVLALRGKRLGCFCTPAPCHGEVILNWLKEQT